MTRLSQPWLAYLLVLGVAGCGRDSEQASATSGPSPAVTTATAPRPVASTAARASPPSSTPPPRDPLAPAQAKGRGRGSRARSSRPADTSATAPGSRLRLTTIQHDIREMPGSLERPRRLSTLRQVRDALSAYVTKESLTASLPASSDENELRQKMLGSSPGPWVVRTDTVSHLVLSSGNEFVLVIGVSSDALLSGARGSVEPLRFDPAGHPSITEIVIYPSDEGMGLPATKVYATTIYHRVSGEPMVSFQIEAPSDDQTRVPLTQRPEGVQVGSPIDRFIPFREDGRSP